MEPLTSATAFATIISLIGQFRTERGASNEVETNEFMSWLTDNRHEEIKDLLELNTNTTIGIKALLTVNQEVLVKKLETLDNALAIYASSLENFSVLANSIRPHAVLSEQSLSILKQLDRSGGTGILLAKSDCIELHILGVNSGLITTEEQRFIADDLKTLTEYNLLRHDVNSNGEDIYLLTRRASKLVTPL